MMDLSISVGHPLQSPRLRDRKQGVARNPLAISGQVSDHDGNTTDHVSVTTAGLREARLDRIHDLVIECQFLLKLSNDREQLLQSICRLIVESGDFCKAWISLSYAPPANIQSDAPSRPAPQLIMRDYVYESANTAQVESGIALPLKDKYSTFGALMLYSTDPEAVDEKQAGLLAQLVDNLAACLAKMPAAPVS